MAAKRAFDVAVAALALIALSPVLAAVALLIWWNSGTPILYRGTRTGEGGRQFQILKFRTMVVNAEKHGGDTTALGDPRITRVGHVLRRFKLDELPQIFNVLRGDMSLVGPRPELPVYTQAYRGVEDAILAVPPGITDLSSLEFRSLDRVVGSSAADVEFETRVLPVKNHLRLKYVRTASFLTDMRILVRTAAAVFCP